MLYTIYRLRYSSLGQSFRFCSPSFLPSLNEWVLWRLSILIFHRRIQHRSWNTFLLKGKVVPVFTTKVFEELEVQLHVFLRVVATFSGQLQPHNPRARNIRPTIGSWLGFRTGQFAEKRLVFEARFVGCPARSLAAISTVVFRSLAHLAFYLTGPVVIQLLSVMLLKKRRNVIIKTVVLHRIIRDSIPSSQLLYIINNLS